MIVRWLGFMIDTLRGCLLVPPEKIALLEERLRSAFMMEYIPARELASLTGTLMSMSLAIGPVSRLMTRAMYALIKSRVYWCDRLKLTEAVKNEIEFWLSGVKGFSSQPTCIWHKPSAVRIAYSDASDTGYMCMGDTLWSMGLI